LGGRGLCEPLVDDAEAANALAAHKDDAVGGFGFDPFFEVPDNLKGGVFGDSHPAPLFAADFGSGADFALHRAGRAHRREGVEFASTFFGVSQIGVQQEQGPQRKNCEHL
jgi:hypothetical protein